MPQSQPAPAIRSSLAEWMVTILLLLFGTTTLVQAFVVPTGSMETTVMVGDHLLVDKLAYSPQDGVSRHLLPYRDVQRGDIIVFQYPLDIRQDYVKRVIGTPGDHVKIVNRQVYVNGQPLVEPYKRHISSVMNSYLDNFPSEPTVMIYDRGMAMLREHVVNGELVVPPGFYFAMGDNRDNSADSRFWGFVPRENIRGKPLVIFWSYDAPTEHWVDPRATVAHAVDLMQHFFTRTRWSRTGLFLRGTHAYGK